MIRPKFSFLSRSGPQTLDSPSLPAATLRSPKTRCLTSITSLHCSLITSSLDTPCRPQPQSPQSLAHTFRRLWGVHRLNTILAFPISSFAPSKMFASLLFLTLTKPSQFHESDTTLSPAFATLTRPVKHKPCVCHSHRKHPGVGYRRSTRVLVPSHSFSSETFPRLRRTLPREQPATRPCPTLHRLAVPRGVR